MIELPAQCGSSDIILQTVLYLFFLGRDEGEEFTLFSSCKHATVRRAENSKSTGKKEKKSVS